jgi:hypothetical protein
MAAQKLHPSYRSIPPEQGCSEVEMTRIAHRVGFGETIDDIRELYLQEGKDPADATWSFCAAQVMLKLNQRSTGSFRFRRGNEHPTTQLAAVKLPIDG